MKPFSLIILFYFISFSHFLDLHLMHCLMSIVQVNGTTCTVALKLLVKNRIPAEASSPIKTFKILNLSKLSQPNETHQTPSRRIKTIKSNFNDRTIFEAIQTFRHIGFETVRSISEPIATKSRSRSECLSRWRLQVGVGRCCPLCVVPVSRGHGNGGYTLPGIPGAARTPPEEPAHHFFPIYLFCLVPSVGPVAVVSSTTISLAFPAPGPTETEPPNSLNEAADQRFLGTSFQTRHFCSPRPISPIHIHAFFHFVHFLPRLLGPTPQFASTFIGSPDRRVWYGP